MALSVGDIAPDFTLYRRTPEGFVPISLQDYRGHFVILLFFPLAFTGVCTKEMCMLSEQWDDYRAIDAEIFGISVDSPQAQFMWSKHSNISVPLLSDFNKEVSRAYDAIHEDDFFSGGFQMLGVSKRAAFVIDRDGMVIYEAVYDEPATMPDFEAIKAVITAHQSVAA